MYKVLSNLSFVSGLAERNPEVGPFLDFVKWNSLQSLSPPPGVAPGVEVGRAHGGQPEFKKEFRERTDKDFVGGLRGPALSLSLVPGRREIGASLREMSSADLRDEAVDRWLATLGRGEAPDDFAKYADNVREKLWRLVDPGGTHSSGPGIRLSC